MIIHKRSKITWSGFLNRNPLALLKASLNNILQHPAIIFPTFTLAFIQFFVLEIIYFSVQFPLVSFFGPLIKTIWSQDYLHYPQNLILLPKIFYYLQIFIYLFIGSFLLAWTSRIVYVLNEHPRVNMKQSLMDTFRLYIHIVFASLIAYFLFQLFTNAYIKGLEILVKLKPLGGSASFWNKALMWTIPYFQFLCGIVASTLVVYVIPIIIIEKEKVFKAIFINFKILFQTFPSTLLIVGIPSLFYLPILALRNNIPFLMNSINPEIQIIVIVLGLIVSMSIDLMIIVSTTTLYLFLKENK